MGPQGKAAATCVCGNKSAVPVGKDDVDCDLFLSRYCLAKFGPGGCKKHFRSSFKTLSRLLSRSGNQGRAPQRARRWCRARCSHLRVKRAVA